MKSSKNVILIGMPGSGKSTVGVVLAKVLGYRFIDSDLEIQSQEGKRLPELIEEFGTEGFLDIEARVNASIEAERCVIATGGSVVYRDSAMQHLKEIGTVVYLKLTCEELIIKRLTPIADKQDINLVLESFRPVNAEVDETKLTLALSNLVENAIKYNKEGGWVHVSLNVDNKYFYVKVEDSGIGIPKESQDAIFERFYRVDKSHSREIGGTGLGLAITRSAILMHRGAIKVYSKEGEGTTFTVRIPLIYVN